ncbi:alpha/beta hydrolase [Sphingorhabdus sp.]|jgi:acetyl esterase/lipase|uniref:alpha/beta hydrolase n=1 Tax=Sphingorhabdus sp. TaxID=1902408 RepID=UPI00260B0E44|nr:alpha/beta hydrolase [Sphingorhabdus sp.]MDH4399544.1 alpha/beta hydrolase [Sphingorhabdus sp.]
MTTRYLVDPELLPMLDAFPPMTLSAETLPMIRSAIPQMMAARPLPDFPVSSNVINIPSGDDGRDIRCLLIQPRTSGTNMPAILHFHGGGHVLGIPEMDQPQLMRWAAELGCLVLSVDYRLAPETPFPGPMDDAYAALRWLNEQCDILGINPDRIAVSGGSAGGAMAACLCLMARDRGEYKIAFQHLEAPRLDDRLAASEDANPFTGEFVWTRANSAFCRDAYLGINTADPYGSAARATSQSDLPPAYIAVGSLDLFVDECLAYTARLTRAGVPVELIVYPGCFHGFKIAAEANVTIRAEDDNIRALRKALA